MLLDARQQILGALSAAGIDDARLEADMIIEDITGHDRAGQLLNEQTKLTPAQIQLIEEIIARRLTHEPLDHILGFRSFYGLEFNIDSNVLSPRPETELLVDYILSQSDPDQELKLLDLGTGSGAIPIALLKMRKKFTAIASDVSPLALDIARQNAAKHQINDRLTFFKSDWFENIAGQFDYIISNPPYIESQIIPTLSPEVQKYDPALALDGGLDGLTPYKIIAKEAAKFLKPQGKIVLEIGYDQGETVPEIFRQNGYRVHDVKKDLSGHDRMVIAAK